jgi:hypothetical protein
MRDRLQLVMIASFRVTTNASFIPKPYLMTSFSEQPNMRPNHYSRVLLEKLIVPNLDNTFAKFMRPEHLLQYKLSVDSFIEGVILFQM